MQELIKLEDHPLPLHLPALIKRYQIAANATRQSYFFIYNGVRVEVFPSESYADVEDRYIRANLTQSPKKNNNVKALLNWLQS